MPYAEYSLSCKCDLAVQVLWDRMFDDSTQKYWTRDATGELLGSFPSNTFIRFSPTSISLYSDAPLKIHLEIEITLELDKPYNSEYCLFAIMIESFRFFLNNY